ncbi:MAG TPA: histidine kinase [Acidobacteriota bacterium]|nr:histidine kinase [Acidobacteriota bacterium]
MIARRQSADRSERFTVADLVPSAMLRWGIYFAFWTALGVLNAATAVTDMAPFGTPAYRPIIYEMSSLYMIGLLVPLVAWVTRRFPLRKETWKRHLAAHLLALPLFSLAHTGGMVLLRKIALGLLFAETYVFSSDWVDFRNDLLYEFYKDVGLYWVIVLLAQGWYYYARFRGQQLEASHLQNRLLEARLENIKGRLQPHFLFNTLNMISSLMHEDVEAADRMITRLSDLLRLSLAAEGRQLVPLKEELKTLEIYLEIMETRFAGTLHSEVEVEACLSARQVPPFLLQPLVENAIRHGLSPRSEGGRLRVEIRPSGQDRLLMVVEDDGVGSRLEPEEMLDKGRGLSSTAERLQRLYSDRHSMRLVQSPLGGLRVELEFPSASSTPPAAK